MDGGETSRWSWLIQCGFAIKITLILSLKKKLKITIPMIRLWRVMRHKQYPKLSLIKRWMTKIWLPERWPFFLFSLASLSVFWVVGIVDQYIRRRGNFSIYKNALLSPCVFFLYFYTTLNPLVRPYWTLIDLEFTYVPHQGLSLLLQLYL